MNKLYKNLDEEEQTPEEGIYTVGDSLLFQFYCGNWSASVNMMYENKYTTSDLIDYIESVDDGCTGGWLDWFDRAFFAELGNSKIKLN